MTTRIATAEWADPSLVEDAYAYRDGTVWLGRSASDHHVPLGYEDDRHVCLVGGSRGGKGTTSIIPALLTWPGSVCVLDPKGENATITASRRGRGSQHSKGMGQAVLLLDPFKAAAVDDSLRGRFNPLDALDPEAEETIDEAGRVADAMVVMAEGVKDPFWDESARAMIKGLILHVLTAPKYEGRRDLITLRKLIMRGDWEMAEDLREQDPDDRTSPHGLLWQTVTHNAAFGELLAGIGDTFVNMLTNSPKQYESVLQTANRNTEFIDSPAMQRLLGASDFQLSDLKTRPEGMSLYLCLPQRYMNTHYRWLRMMIGLTATEMEKVRGQPATGHPVLMVLDEFAGLKRMEVIEHAVAQIAGYGVKMFFVLQSLEQLKGVYKDNWETFLANSGLKVFFNVEDNFSRDYASKLIGETEVVREVRSANQSTSESESVSHSVSRSESVTSGRSSSTGTSETEGTNSSVNKGRSWGVNSSQSRSKTYNYAQGVFWNTYDWDHISEGRSQSEGRSKGWSEGSSHGVSHGTSRSRTDGTSESRTTGTSETEGTTRGTSQSRTAGTSETIQKRALITPDEIGQVFARIDDREQRGYPGMALVVISGARPVPVHRVNYFEDFQFIGLFDPHPDYPLLPPKTMRVTGETCGDMAWVFDPDKLVKLRLEKWLQGPDTMVTGGAPLGAFVTFENETVARLLAARAGRFKALADKFSEGPLYQIEYFDDGSPVTDPFAELRKFCELLEAGMRVKQKEIVGKRLLVRLAGGVCGIIAALVLMGLGSRLSSAGIFFLVVFGGLATGMGVWSARLSAELKKYGGPHKSRLRQLHESS
jgi:type IV secretory pathway TraG/TraD family ATPase VirD4